MGVVKRKQRKPKCKCSYGYCCDACWALAAKDERCRLTKSCKNPAGHTGICGPLKNTQSIQLTEANILGIPLAAGTGTEHLR